MTLAVPRQEQVSVIQYNYFEYSTIVPGSSVHTSHTGLLFLHCALCTVELVPTATNQEVRADTIKKRVTLPIRDSTVIINGILTSMI